MAAPVTIPAMVTAHSHAFQRDLRGVGEPGGAAPSDFWSWREPMYRLAGALDPAGMREVAARCYAEMRMAGYGAVGEFHYVHHRADGTPYDEPNAMALAVLEAAYDVGLAIVLLPAAYHRAGFDRPPDPGQRRFCDPDVDTFLGRVDALRARVAADVAGSEGRAAGPSPADVGHREGTAVRRGRVGVAAHSVRAVPGDWLREIAAYSDTHGVVRHVHAAEQRREIEECEAEHGCSPIELLHRTGFLGPRASVVHGIHVSDRDIALLAETGTTVVCCPLTEGNLGDGYPRLLRYRDAGVPLAIGSDSNVVLDPFEETRELETLARREGQTRAALLAHHGDLWAELARAGRAALGLDEADVGTIEIDRDHPRLRGVPDEALPAAVATCASADVVMRGGEASQAGPARAAM